MIVLTDVEVDPSFEFPAGETIDNYVSGVYFQEYFDPSTNITTRDYFMPKDCEKVISDLKPELASMVKGYNCPDTSMKISGQHGDGAEAYAFEYVINSCESMKPLRVKLGLPE